MGVGGAACLGAALQKGCQVPAHGIKRSTDGWAGRGVAAAAASGGTAQAARRACRRTEEASRVIPWASVRQGRTDRGEEKPIRGFLFSLTPADSQIPVQTCAVVLQCYRGEPTAKRKPSSSEGRPPTTPSSKGLDLSSSELYSDLPAQGVRGVVYDDCCAVAGEDLPVPSKQPF